MILDCDMDRSRDLHRKLRSHAVAPSQGDGVTAVAPDRVPLPFRSTFVFERQRYVDPLASAASLDGEPCHQLLSRALYESRTVAKLLQFPPEHVAQLGLPVYTKLM